MVPGSDYRVSGASWLQRRPSHKEHDDLRRVTGDSSGYRLEALDQSLMKALIGMS
jgi:hypothetical protein